MITGVHFKTEMVKGAVIAESPGLASVAIEVNEGASLELDGTTVMAGEHRSPNNDQISVQVDTVDNRPRCMAFRSPGV